MIIISLRKLFIISTAALFVTHTAEGLINETPWIGLIIWSIPIITFNVLAIIKPTIKLYQVCGFMILIYFMSSCLKVFGYPNPNPFHWVEFFEIILIFFIAIYSARQMRKIE
ncbi:MAG: DUF2069 domain-containing protein [Pseudomonadota bacterium]|nr:DUF2069 domain-containing protein [Pseudomonadota bacterium]